MQTRLEALRSGAELGRYVRNQTVTPIADIVHWLFVSNAVRSRDCQRSGEAVRGRNAAPAYSAF
jgi:hypothetical protein